MTRGFQISKYIEDALKPKSMISVPKRLCSCPTSHNNLRNNARVPDLSRTYCYVKTVKRYDKRALVTASTYLFLNCFYIFVNN